MPARRQLPVGALAGLLGGRHLQPRPAARALTPGVHQAGHAWLIMLVANDHSRPENDGVVFAESLSYPDLTRTSITEDSFYNFSLLPRNYMANLTYQCGAAREFLHQAKTVISMPGQGCVARVTPRYIIDSLLFLVLGFSLPQSKSELQLEACLAAPPPACRLRLGGLSPAAPPPTPGKPPRYRLGRPASPVRGHRQVWTLDSLKVSTLIPFCQVCVRARPLL